ncbi:MAG: AraC family transcriptional regulator [Eubacteriales bacterium]|nr:AraC family transcriptional regulator [Eubacteriales bacterium]
MSAGLYNESLIFVNTKPVSPLLHIYSAGILRPDPSYSYHGKKLARHLFEYVRSGRGYINKNGKQYVLEKGCFSITRRCDEVTYYSDKSEPYEKMWFSAEGSLIEKLTELYGLNCEVFVIKAETGKLFEELFEILQNKGHDDKSISKIFFDIILEAAGAYSTMHSRHMTTAEKIKDYLDARLLENLSLDEIAAEFSISKRHLTRIFSASYSRSIKAYMNDCRLTAACRLISDSEYNINEIALALNYCDQSYFSNKFKKRYGVYPLEYRKNFLLTIKDKPPAITYGLPANLPHSSSMCDTPDDT